MAGPGVFHVEFGINETQLTRLLEKNQFNAAEKMIIESTNPSFLDEGCYQRTPLYIVLCGTNEATDDTPSVRNLYLAKQLIASGANVNYRIPVTSFGSEYMSPGKTPMELVVEFYNLITQHSCHSEEDVEDFISWDPIRYKVIGLDKQHVISYDDIVEQLTQLVFIMLGQGGDGNVGDENHMGLLHRTVVFSQNLELTKLLCENGADLNMKDIRGNTPLMAVCDAFPLGISGFIENKPFGNPYTGGCTLEGKDNFITYLLSLKDVKLDVQNKLGRTCLFHCMVKGDLKTAEILLSRGCDSTLKGQIKDVEGNTSDASPLFASLCSLKIITKHLDRYITQEQKSCQFLAHLVDSGHFTKSAIVKELRDLIDNEFPDMKHLKRFEGKLIHQMFGGTTSSLRQQCARTILEKCFIKNPCPNDRLFSSKYATHIHTRDFSHNTDYITYVSEYITSEVLERMVNLLILPKDSLVHFEVELLRQRILALFRTYHWFRFYEGEVDDIMGYLSLSDESDSDEDDSDLEYW